MEGKVLSLEYAVILLEILPKEEEFMKYLYYKNEITSY